MDEIRDWLVAMLDAGAVHDGAVMFSVLGKDKAF